MKYRDIIREMERQGRYCDADDLRQSLDDNSIYDGEQVRSREQSYDGCGYSSVQHSAREAYDRIKRRTDDPYENPYP
jgi:hypothetical protein